MYNSSSQTLLQAFVPVTVVVMILLALVHAFVREKVKRWRRWSWSDGLVRESALPVHATSVDM